MARLTAQERAEITAAYEESFAACVGTKPSSPAERAPLAWAISVVQASPRSDWAYTTARAEVASYLRVYANDLAGTVASFAGSTTFDFAAMEEDAE